MNGLSWPSIKLNHWVLKHTQLSWHDHCFIHIPESIQKSWLQHLFFPTTHTQPTLILHLQQQTYGVHHPVFWQHIKVIMCHDGLLANLTLYDNLLLPALYHQHPISNKQVKEVITLLDLTEQIHQQAAERDNELHARIALGQCLLYPPKMIVIQDICTSLSPKNKHCFYDLLHIVLQRTGAGLCYISSSEHVSFPVHFSHQLRLEPV